MRKIKLLLASALSLIAWTGVMAQNTSDADYLAAKEAITEGGTYRIKTTVGETDYYVTTGGGLTSVKDNAGYFTITKTSGGYFGTGFRIDSGTDRFTNPPLSNNQANLKPGSFAHSTGDRTDWERQILYLNGDGKYAIRSCNCADGTSSWNDAARTHWTYYMVGETVTPCYSYDKAYIWDFEGPLTAVNVTYKLVEADGSTEVSTTTVKQEANSAVISPLPGTGINYNGFFHEKFYYDYAVSGTIGDTDCTITITRTEKAGVVKALTDLSNNKAYNIGCDRGAMIAYNGSMCSTALNDATANAQPYGKFALLKYEDNYYIFSIDENKFVKNDASVALDLTEVGFSTEDAMVMTAQTAPYFLWTFNKEGKYLNTNGNQPLGYVINAYSTPDPGNLYYMVAVDDFDPTAALAELEAYFHPSYFVTYIVKDELGNTIFTSDPQPAKAGAHITSLPAEFQRNYYTYNVVDVTISEQNTIVEFTATWDGPFEISADFASAHWYDMAMRGTWYVTSAIKDGDGAYKTQNANTMGLVEDSYQWAFLGNGYDGFKIINKAEGDGKSFGWTDATATDQGIPTIMADGEGHHAWNIVASTSTTVPAGSFCLNVPGTTLYINQYGGKGGSVKFWNSANNVGDEGSAFTVFDVPSNFASFVVDEIAPAFESTGYFTFTDAAKAAIGWDPAYTTDCPFETYKSLKENLAAVDMTDLSNFVLPETGYYILKNKNYGTYMGIDPSDANMYGNYAAANLPKHIVKLTKTGDATYTIGLMGKFAPAAVAQSKQVTATAEAGTYTVVVPAVGYAVFSANPSEQYAALHCAGGGSIVGWEAAAAASQWIVEDATSIQFTVGSEGYATAYMPFPFEFATEGPSLPDAISTWTFDDTANPLAGTGAAALKPATHTKKAANNSEVTLVESLEAANITTIAGPASGNGAISVPVGSSLLASGIAGAEQTTYTLMFDVSASDVSSYSCFFNNKADNKKDGSFFIKDGGVGVNSLGLGYHGTIAADTWYRVVLAVEDNVANVYVDGELVGKGTGADATHWQLNNDILFCADDDHEEKPMNLAEIRFWNVALTREQAALLGNINGEAFAEVPVPEAKGVWTFDNASDLTAGTGVATMTATSGVTANDDGSVTVPVGDQLEMTTNLAETSLDTYTLMMDVKFPDVTSYTSLFQNKLNNDGDASLFINNGKIGLGGALGYNGTIEADTWYRVVFVVDDLYGSLYVNGVKVSQSTGPNELHWQLSTGLLFFRDDDVDEKVVTTTEIRFWDEALTYSQVDMLGVVGTDPSSDEAPKAFTGKVENNYLAMTELSGTIPAQTAVVIKANPKDYTLNIVGDAAPVTDNDLVGTLEPIDAAGKYVLAKPAGEKVGFYKANPNPDDPKKGKIAACKAYLEVPASGVKGFIFKFDDDATGIENLNTQSSTLNTQDSTIYNLAGQRISKMQKGINIVNGKKILK